MLITKTFTTHRGQEDKGPTLQEASRRDAKRACYLYVDVVALMIRIRLLGISY